MWFLTDEEYDKLKNGEVISRVFTKFSASVYITPCDDFFYVNHKIVDGDNIIETRTRYRYHNILLKEIFILQFANDFDNRAIAFMRQYKKNK